MRKLLTMIFVLAFCASLQAQFQQKKDDVLTCDFTGSKINSVYYITTRAGCHTVFELPGSVKINHLIIGDQKFWKAESDGQRAVVKPIEAGIETTMSLVTVDDKLFCFVIQEQAATGGANYQKKVIINCLDEKPMISSIQKKPEGIPESREEIQKKIEDSFNEKKFQMLKNLSMEFKVRKNIFGVARVYDDGIFTYIDLTGSQFKPAVFLGRNSDRKKLEPVTYTDNNGIYQIHETIKKGEFFILKAGPDWTKITKKT